MHPSVQPVATPAPAPEVDPVLEALADRLAVQGLSVGRLACLPDQGLAHRHVVLHGTGWLARVPKHSQLNLPPVQHLAQEVACFRRAAPSGHTPALHGSLAPGPGLPWGALLVEHVHGTVAGATHAQTCVLDALAAIHRLPVPPLADRAPLAPGLHPVQEWLQVLGAQAASLAHAEVPAATRELVQQRLLTLPERLGPTCARMPTTLVAADAHPGNFLVRPDGRAVLVDLEKMRYGLAPLDVAHATLYTSTTWDVATSFTLTATEVHQAHAHWLDAMGHLAPWYAPGMVALREAMWLWSLTWCAKWLAESACAAKPSASGEDWSQAHHPPALVQHVGERARHYLSGECVQRQLDELSDLSRALSSDLSQGRWGRDLSLSQAQPV